MTEGVTILGRSTNGTVVGVALTGVGGVFGTDVGGAIKKTRMIENNNNKKTVLTIQHSAMKSMKF